MAALRTVVRSGRVCQKDNGLIRIRREPVDRRWDRNAGHWNPWRGNDQGRKAERSAERSRIQAGDSCGIVGTKPGVSGFTD